MKSRFRKILTQMHFVTLILVIGNALVKFKSGYSFEADIEFGIELFVALSGVTIFFFYLKPFKYLSYYFSLYAAGLVILIFGLIFRGIFLALILSVILFPLIPDDKEFEENGIIISTPFEGFMSSCCSYEIRERKLLIFQRNLGKWKLDGEGMIDFNSVKIDVQSEAIDIRYTTGFEPGVVKSKRVPR